MPRRVQILYLEYRYSIAVVLHLGNRWISYREEKASLLYGAASLYKRGQSMQDQEPSAQETKGRGRHRSVEAEASILKAALYLLERKSLRQVTTDAIAKRAGVSKATLYKWWPNKSMVALDAYLGVMNERVSMPDTGSAISDFSLQLQSVITFYRSSLGRLFCQFIAEGQSDPGFLALFRERFLYARRDAARVMWKRGVLRGEIRGDLDSEIVLDLIYGPMIFRLLAGHGSLCQHDSQAMVEAIFSGIQQKGYRPSVKTAPFKAGGRRAPSL
jgi:AcrR family transcriptional regulator